MEKRNPEVVEGSAPTVFGTARDVVARYSRCHQCGANLHFSHITDFARNLTQETARCPECGHKARRVVHKLQ
jgi:DNA-directed RNA polymerase subunit RPC12/RpoP